MGEAIDKLLWCVGEIQPETEGYLKHRRREVIITHEEAKWLLSKLGKYGKNRKRRKRPRV
jgi:hypothetical protein